jgi:hypothetical protein
VNGWLAATAAFVVVCLGPASTTVRAADRPDALAHARILYNQGNYDGAIAAAEQAHLTPAYADSADLIAARAYLERFRDSAVTDDLTNARNRLGRLDPQRLASRERAEYLVGLGETLYFDGAFGAAADLFDSVLMRDDIGPDARDRVIDWWASAVDEDARPRTEIERQQMYQRIRDRMQRELGAQPTSASAAYWISAAARGEGDLQAAWDAALAAWVRASMSTDHGTALRADIDRLVLRAIVPERAKSTAQPPELVKGEWERFKEKWRK